MAFKFFTAKRILSYAQCVSCPWRTSPLSPSCVCNTHTVSANLEEPAYKNPRLALWSEIKNGLGWRGLASAKN